MLIPLPEASCIKALLFLPPRAIQDPTTGEWYQDEVPSSTHPAGQASGPSAFKGISSLGAYGAKKQAEAEKARAEATKERAEAAKERAMGQQKIHHAQKHVLNAQQQVQKQGQELVHKEQQLRQKEHDLRQREQLLTKKLQMQQKENHKQVRAGDSLAVRSSREAIK